MAHQTVERPAAGDCTLVKSWRSDAVAPTQQHGVKVTLAHKAITVVVALERGTLYDLQQTGDEQIIDIPVDISGKRWQVDVSERA